MFLNIKIFNIRFLRNQHSAARTFAHEITTSSSIQRTFRSFIVLLFEIFFSLLILEEFLIKAQFVNEFTFFLKELNKKQY